MLQRWTNDSLRSTPHRVVNRRGRDRFSVPFFYAPRADALVECLPPFRVGEGEKVRYPPVLVKDYMQAKLEGMTAAVAAARAGAGKEDKE